MYKTKNEILIKSKEAIGRKFGGIDKYNRISNMKNKGNLGQIIEESFFNYKVNNKSEPDFIDAGVELKVTPYKLNKNGSYSAKERLVLNIIDYNKEYKLEFNNSSFWKKNKALLLMFYLHDFDIYKKDMKITDTILFEYPEDDLEIIKKDYYIIRNKIRNGMAHQISESDTMYLAACTKGATGESYRTQPMSDIPAKARAFSLKGSYMTSILRKYVFGKEENEKILKNVSLSRFPTFEEYIENELKNYYGKTTLSLLHDFDIQSKAKNFRAMIISKMLGVRSISRSDEFIKSGMKFKTVLINKSGKIKENMSFPHFDFKRLVQESWDDSEIRNLFESVKWVFAVFKEQDDCIEIFEKIVIWSMPQEVIDNEVKIVWEETKDVLNSGKIVKRIIINKNEKKQFLTNFPHSTENKIIHIRPHAKNAEDTLVLPIPDKLTGKLEYTKQCFWLDRRYILKIIKGDV